MNCVSPMLSLVYPKTSVLHERKQMLLQRAVDAALGQRKGEYALLLYNNTSMINGVVHHIVDIMRPPRTYVSYGLVLLKPSMP